MSEQIEYAEVTQVWPGIVIDLLREKVVLTLTRMTDETQEAYVERCNEIVHYAISKSPQPEPSVFDFSDTTKYRQTGPDSWESVTPGTESKEEETPYTCYVDGCPGAYFHSCDRCGKEGCSDHISISSKLRIQEDDPFSYLCRPCHDAQRKAYEARWEIG